MTKKSILSITAGAEQTYHLALSVVFVCCLCLIPRLGARFTTTGVEGNGEVTAFTFGLLKTGDKKPAARKESRILKDVIYHLCQTSAKTV